MKQGEKCRICETSWDRRHLCAWDRHTTNLRCEACCICFSPHANVYVCDGEISEFVWREERISGGEFIEPWLARARRILLSPLYIHPDLELVEQPEQPGGLLKQRRCRRRRDCPLERPAMLLPPQSSSVPRWTAFSMDFSLTLPRAISFLFLWSNLGGCGTASADPLPRWEVQVVGGVVES